MSNTIKLNHCPKCGIPIPAEAPQGLCPKCVLLGAAIATEAGGPATATSEIPSLERVAAAFPQLEILELIGRGKSSREVAKALHLSVKTVDTHRTHLKGKLKLKSTLQLTHYAVCWMGVQDSPRA